MPTYEKQQGPQPVAPSPQVNSGAMTQMDGVGVDYQQLANASPRSQAAGALQRLIDSSPRLGVEREVGRPPVQRQVPGPLQMNGAIVDLLTDKAKDVGWNYVLDTLTKLKVKESAIAVVKRLALWTGDYVTSQMDLFAQFSATVTPYLGLLEALVAVIGEIPEAVWTMIGYLIGMTLRKVDKALKLGIFTEARIAGFLETAGGLIEILPLLINFIKDVAAGRVVTAAYNAYGMYKQRKAGTAKGKDEDAAPQELVNKDVGFAWLNMSMPRHTKWGDEPSAMRGGIVMKGGFGVRAFGQQLGSHEIDFRLPYEGDWSLSFSDVQILSSPIALEGAFGIDAATIDYVNVSSGKGLESLEVSLENFSFGEGTIVADYLSVQYSARSGKVKFTGETRVNILGHELEGDFALDLDRTGAFKGGKLTLKLNEEFEVIKNHLKLSEPSFAGEWADGKLKTLALQGNLALQLPGDVEMNSVGTKVAWDDEEGFVGSVEDLTIDLPLSDKSVIRLTVNEGQISAAGLVAKKMTLRFEYDKAPADPDSDEAADEPAAPKMTKQGLSALLPGFNLDWMSLAGLEQLHVSMVAKDVGVDRTGFHIGQTEKQVNKLAMRMFGVAAQYDGDKGTMTLDGEWNHSIDHMPSLSLDFPIVPGINGGLSLSSNASLNAGIKTTLQKEASAEAGKTVWNLSGGLSAGLEGAVRASFNLSAGHPLLASIHAGLFAEAALGLKTTADLHGKLIQDDDTGRLEMPSKVKDKPRAKFSASAGLKASLGAEVEARAFYVFKAKLWEYKFKTWNMGAFRIVGEVVPTEAGGYTFTLDQDKTGFEGGEPKKPEVTYKALDAAKDIENAEGKITDKYYFSRLVHDLVDHTSHLKRKERVALFAKLDKLRADSVPSAMDLQLEWMEEMAPRTGDTEEGFSLLMLPQEWVKYSTTSGLVGTTNRDTVAPIDAALTTYHATADVGEKKVQLTKLIKQTIPAYMAGKGKRKEIVGKLLLDAERELARLG